MFSKIFCKLNVHDWEWVKVGDWIISGYDCTKCGRRRKYLNRAAGQRSIRDE